MKELFDEVSGQELGGAVLSAREKMRAEMEHQIKLAKELYQRGNPDASFEGDEENALRFRNEAMEQWREKKYSQAFRDILNHTGFVRHPRLQGDVHKVTLSDMEYFLEHHKLPER